MTISQPPNLTTYKIQNKTSVLLLLLDHLYLPHYSHQPPFSIHITLPIETPPSFRQPHASCSVFTFLPAFVCASTDSLKLWVNRWHLFHRFANVTGRWIT